MIAPDDLADTADVARILGVRPASLRSMRAARAGRYASMPAPLRLVCGRPVWRTLDVERWAASLADRSDGSRPEQRGDWICDGCGEQCEYGTPRWHMRRGSYCSRCHGPADFR